MKNRKIVVSLIALIIIMLLAGTMFFSVSENQYAVIKQMGKITRTIDEPGLNIKIPLIQNVTKISSAKRLYDISPSEVITSDKKTMVVDAYVVWQVDDPVKYIQSLNASKNTAEGRIDVLVYNAIKTVISNTSQEELIASRDGSIEVNVNDVVSDIEINDMDNTSEDKAVKSVNLSTKFLEQLGHQDQSYGININSINIKILDMPEENKAAVYQRMISERENISAAYIAQGDSEAKIIRNTTDKEVAITISEAEANAEGIVAEGEAEYMKILSKAYNDQSKADFYLYRRSLDAAKETMKGENKTLFLTSDSPLAEIFSSAIK